MENILAHPITGADNKVESIIRYCTYMIATGKWPEGSKLPSIREAERTWSVNRLTIQKAYTKLGDTGLVECRTKSGYYVSRRMAAPNVTRHRYELENLYERFRVDVLQQTGLSPLAVFRYLANLAEIKVQEKPECAFIECTMIQSEGHAREIMQRFNIPVLAMTTGDLAGSRTRIPNHVRVVLTTLFHYEELKFLDNSPESVVAAVPIEVSPLLVQEIERSPTRAVLLESEEHMAEGIAADAHAIMEDLRLEIVVTHDFEKSLNTLCTDVDTIVLLSPRHWGAVRESWRNHPRVRPVVFSISESAWPSIAEAIGMPLGAAL